MNDEKEFDELITLTQMFFEQKPDKQYFDRLRYVTKPLIILAKSNDGSLIGCKIGYQISSDSFYSWLGGVHPNFRRQGIAQFMMQLQTEWCIRNNFQKIRTKALIHNSAMYQLNFMHDFRVIGNEIAGKYGHALLFSKTLPTFYTH